MAFKRAQSLDNGVSISWLEQSWKTNIINGPGIKKTDYGLLHQLGFKSIRIPVAFRDFEERNIPLDKILARIDEVVAQCHKYGFKLVIDYHGGKLDDGTYQAETTKIINLWLKIAQHYKHISPDDLIFELYNEAPHMDTQTWKDAIYNIVTAVRKADPQRTFIVGASNYNSIYELSRFVRLADENIIYSFHFYEPFLFTHQGAEWIGVQVATTGVPFPYNGENFPSLNPYAVGTPGESNYKAYRTDGNEQSVHDKLMIPKNWGQKYNVPILCGEYGVYNKYADLQSRCRYIKAVRKNLKLLNIPGMLWDYNTNFSIFEGTPSIEHLPDCMRDALQANK